MHDAKSRIVNKILDRVDHSSEGQSYSKERQHTAQAFNLHIERRDGRHSEGFAWSHYVGYQWTDEGDHERLVVIFGNRAVEIEGQKLGVLTTQIREGQLNGVKELVSRQATLLLNDNPGDEPVILSVKSYPNFEQILNEIKGEQDDDKHRHTRRAAGR